MEVSSCHGYESDGLRKACGTDINFGVVGIYTQYLRPLGDGLSLLSVLPEMNMDREGEQKD